jgi:hypothetical protein
LANGNKRRWTDHQDMRGMPIRSKTPVKVRGSFAAHYSNLAITARGMDIVGPLPTTQGNFKFAVSPSNISPSALKWGLSLPSLQPLSESFSCSKSSTGLACPKSSQLIMGSNSIARISESTADQLGWSFASHPSIILSPTVQSKGPTGKFSQL